MHTGRLVFTPQDPLYPPEDPDSIVKRLQEIRFCGDRVEGLNGRHYLLGDRFMQLVAFMGCSPFINLEATTDGQPFCHLFIDGPYDQPIFLQGRNTTSPRCEDCRKRIPDWHPLLEQWQADPEHFQASCPHCGHEQSPGRYNWRQSAGSGRLFLCVENIFPNEAIPTPELLKTLETGEATCVPWSYFYIQD